VGECDGLAKVKLTSMITLTTLPLAGGQRGDGRSDWPEAGEHAPTFAKMSAEDEGLTTDHEDLFDVYVMLNLSLNLSIFFVLYLPYFVFEMTSTGFPH
jgi:hypothetical protein